MREALRLGILMLKPDSAKVIGPFGLERPLAMIKISEIRDNRAREAHKRLFSGRVKGE